MRASFLCVSTKGEHEESPKVNVSQSGSSLTGRLLTHIVFEDIFLQSLAPVVG